MKTFFRKLIQLIKKFLYQKITDVNPVEKQALKNRYRVLVEITKPPSGMYLLPYNVGQKVDIEIALAKKMEKTGHAKIIK